MEARASERGCQNLGFTYMQVLATPQIHVPGTDTTATRKRVHKAPILGGGFADLQANPILGTHRSRQAANRTSTRRRRSDVRSAPAARRDVVLRLSACGVPSSVLPVNRLASVHSSANVRCATVRISTRREELSDGDEDRRRQGAAWLSQRRRGADRADRSEAR